MALVPALATKGAEAHVSVRPIVAPVAVRRVFAAVRQGSVQRPSVATALEELTRAAQPLSETLGTDEH